MPPHQRHAARLLDRGCPRPHQQCRAATPGECLPPPASSAVPCRQVAQVLVVQAAHRLAALDVLHKRLVGRHQLRKGTDGERRSLPPCR